LDSRDFQVLAPERSDEAVPVYFQPPVIPRPKPKILLPLILFLVTILTTLISGTLLQVGFLRQAGLPTPPLDSALVLDPKNWLMGASFSFTLLAILIAHELGHFLACRYYGIDATYPYVLPAPPVLTPFGTFGAVIRIRSPFYSSRQLFDVGIAGPIAGFAVLLPALVIGLGLSTIFQGSIQGEAIEFGEPLLFKWLSKLIFSEADGHINLHPVGFAAWFGMLATSLNLLPIGQLDGGHIIYALVGSRRHRWVSYGGFLGLAAISALSWPMMGYFMFGLLLFLFGMRHPKPIQESPVGKERLILAAVALVILLVTFMPVPVRLI
jgi:membrane-associated protease RseP (regulator of RpoE activity)